MKKKTKMYWWVNGFVCLFILFSAIFSFSMKEGFVHLGYPDYFRYELNIAKLLGVVALLIPQTPARIREWVYACYGIVLISAAIAHLCSRDPIYRCLFPLIDLTIFSFCVRYLHKQDAIGQCSH